MSEIRTAARQVGLVFKKTNARLNGSYLFKFEDRESGEKQLSNVPFWHAYELVQSGYISTFNKKTGKFDGDSDLLLN